MVIAKRDKAAGLKLLKRIIKRYGRPRLVVTDALRAFSTAKDDIGAADRHQVGHRLNSRAENSHQRRSLVPLQGDYRLQHLAFMVDGTSQVAELAVDLHERLIQMPCMDAPFAQDGFESFGRVIGCDHVSGLHARPVTTAGRYGDARTGRKSPRRAFELDGILLHFLARI